jgi:hypothetical protein
MIFRISAGMGSEFENPLSISVCHNQRWTHLTIVGSEDPDELAQALRAFAYDVEGLKEPAPKSRPVLKVVSETSR